MSDWLPPAFQFSQNSLQDYVDCQRRFQLRYVVEQKWPAAESEPIDEQEHFLEMGSRFHLLVQRHLTGLDTELLRPSDPMLAEWWDAYLKHPIPDLPAANQLPEINLSASVGGQRLTATFDLLAFEPGQRAVIVDWKTTQRVPKREKLAARLQTRVYPFVLVEGGKHLFGGDIKPEQVEMVYWFANDPTQPHRFAYNAQQYDTDRAYLAGMLTELLARQDEAWPLTDNLNQCNYCVYRSLCDRGVKAGLLDEQEMDLGSAEPDPTSDFDFDLDNVEEIAF